MAKRVSRKRKSSAAAADDAGKGKAGGGQPRNRNRKRAKPNHAAAPPPSPAAPPATHIKQDLLARYFPRVESLRSYLLSRLPASSRIRRKRLASFGRRGPAAAADVSAASQQERALEELLTRTLDSTLVGCAVSADDDDVDDDDDADAEEAVGQLRATFSQAKKADESNVTISDASSGPMSLQAEIVDFSVWLMFARAYGAPAPDNVLCFGYQRTMPMPMKDRMAGAEAGADVVPPCTIPDLYTSRRPQNAQCLKELPWPQLLALLGASGEQIMVGLLTRCSLFLAVDAGVGNYIQVTGKPLFSMWYTLVGDDMNKPAAPAREERRPSDITLVRRRIFYASPSITAKNAVGFGLHRSHVLNRFLWVSPQQTKTLGKTTNRKTQAQATLHIAMHVFPRQFGLHNVFTSPVDRAQTSQKFLDYTMRETEIASKYGSLRRRGPDCRIAVPKRLRGLPLQLVEQMRIRHAKCAYSALVAFYCSARNGGGDDGGDDARDDSSPLVDLAVPLAQVSAFCQAVLQKVVPGAFWGSGAVRAHNKAIMLQRVDDFIRLLRYENQSLHGLLEGLRMSEIEWLTPPGFAGRPMSKPDRQKRNEIFAEFVYYLFDSLLMPLIRSHFYVTESNTHRNRVFYFRHDVWRRIAEPALASIQAARFEEVPAAEATRIMETRRLGCGRVRLLPKNNGMRTIINLSRRVMKPDGSRLAPSTNATMEPVAAMLNYERAQHPQRFGSSMMSTQAIYGRLRQFRERFDGNAKTRPTFYLCKVDVKSAFDTIPQDAMVRLIGDIPTLAYYHIDKHSEISAPGRELGPSHNMPSASSRAASLPQRKWRAVAKAGTDPATFAESVEAAHAPLKKNTVFVDTAYRSTRSSESLAVLAAYHVKQHMVQMGSRFYRQREGIPQGSVLSSLLCSYFYADLEKTELGFLEGEDCLLLRLIDDFLLITTDRNKAARFVDVMHRGHPRYGVQVNPSKTVVNFDLVIDGARVPRHPAGMPFPYCGVAIHPVTLNLTKDRDAKKHGIFDSLTVERTRAIGSNFKRKTLMYFKIQASTMFFDMSYNARRTTLHNLHGAFVETASKMWAYARSLPAAQRPRPPLVIRTIDELAELAYAVLSDKSRVARGAHYTFSVHKVHFKLILLHAFAKVLGRRQTAYKEVLAWIETETRTLQDAHQPRLPLEYTL